jgi:hypothetical protein
MGKTELDILRDVSGRLESAGIEFMLTGSIAMNYYARPRMTRDIDIVVALQPGQTDTILENFGRDYYCDPEMVSAAITNSSMFNLIHLEEVIKVDFIVRKNDAYRLEEFARRKRIDIDDFSTWIVSREDLILSKLVWAKDSKSEMQLKDAQNLFSNDCDLQYLKTRATALSVGAILEEMAKLHG